MTDLFIKLVNMSISAGWLVLAVLVLRFVLKKAPKWVNPVLWGLVGLRLILPFSIESVISLIPSAETISPEIMYDPTPTIHSGVYSLNSIVNPIISESFAPEPLASANPLQIWISIACGVWVIGIVIMLIYTSLSYMRLSKRVKMAVLLRDNIYQSENVVSPFVLGLWQPRIYLPFDITNDDIFHVIAHEQTHIKRYDHWIKPIGFLLLTLYWFNPVLWLAYILLCRDIELACDERVIRDMDIEQRADYSQALLSCSISRKMVTACPLAFGEVCVKERVRNVLNYKKPAFWIIIVAVVSCIVVAACFLTNPKSDSGEPDLSFLNYSNAISIVADMDEVQVIYCPPVDDEGNGSIQIGAVDGADLAKYLDRATWEECGAPRESLSSPESVEFVIEDDYRITVYKRKHWAIFRYAVVKYVDEVRYYRTDRDDYEDAVAIFKGQSEDDYDEAAAVLAEQSEEDVQWDTRPSLNMEGIAYFDPYMPVSELPHGYELAGTLSEEQANDTGLVGCEYYINQNDSDSFYVYQECGTPIDINTVDTEQRQMAYKRWIREGLDTVENRMLTLDDVIMLAESGNDLTWGDFDRYSYIETGSGLYIRVYEIDEMFSLWIGGSGTDTEPMYIYLQANDGGDERIDIRTEDAREFIDQHKNNPVMIRSYVFKESEEIIKPNIALFDDGKFSFSFSAISSYFGFGDYEIKDDRLTLRTDDGKYIYVFDMVDDTLIFDADASSEETWFSDIYDGAVFR